MKDRELLELAAKAAGIELGGWSEDLHAFWKGRTGDATWNPLTDDGDALRLAVKLRINVEHMTTMGGRPEGINCWPVGRGDAGANEQYGTDHYAATRCAIVRAAAEIGRGMTKKAPSVDLPEDNYYKSLAEAEELERSKT